MDSRTPMTTGEAEDNFRQHVATAIQTVPTDQDTLPGQIMPPQQPIFAVPVYQMPVDLNSTFRAQFVQPDNQPMKFAAAVNPRKLAELPTFDGSADQWSAFITAYRMTTEQYGYSSFENHTRLRQAIKGDAFEEVRGLMINPACVGEVIKRLEKVFAHPETLIKSHIDAIRRAPLIRQGDYAALIYFSRDLTNMVGYVRATNAVERLSDYTLLDELIGKLPINRREDWMKHYVRTLKSKASIPDFAAWLEEEADFLRMACAAGIQIENLTVTVNTIHDIEAVPAIPSTPISTTDSYYKYIEATAHGPNGSEDIYVFIDDGSKVSLIDHNLATRLGLKGQTRQLKRRWVDGTEVTHESFMMDLEISRKGTTRKNTLNSLFTIKNLTLPGQTLDVRKSFPNVNLPVASYEKARPLIVLGIGHTEMTMPLQSKNIGNQFVAQETPLGWTIYGTGQPNCLQSEHPSVIGYIESQDISDTKPYTLRNEDQKTGEWKTKSTKRHSNLLIDYRSPPIEEHTYNLRKTDVETTKESPQAHGGYFESEVVRIRKRIANDGHDCTSVPHRRSRHNHYDPLPKSAPHNFRNISARHTGQYRRAEGPPGCRNSANNFRYRKRNLNQSEFAIDYY